MCGVLLGLRKCSLNISSLPSHASLKLFSPCFHHRLPPITPPPPHTPAAPSPPPRSPPSVPSQPPWRPGNGAVKAHSAGPTNTQALKWLRTVQALMRRSWIQEEKGRDHKISITHKSNFVYKERYFSLSYLTQRGIPLPGSSWAHSGPSYGLEPRENKKENSRRQLGRLSPGPGPGYHFGH